MSHIPPPSTLPSSEGVSASIGSTMRFATEDHRHQRLTSTTMGVTDGSGYCTITFTRSFSAAPGMVMTEINGSATQPSLFKVDSWVMTGALYTGVIIRAWRGQVVPQNLVTLLIGAVFNIFGGSAASINFSCVAIQRGDV